MLVEACRRGGLAAVINPGGEDEMEFASADETPLAEMMPSSPRSDCPATKALAQT